MDIKVEESELIRRHRTTRVGIAWAVLAYLITLAVGVGLLATHHLNVWLG